MTRDATTTTFLFIIRSIKKNMQSMRIKSTYKQITPVSFLTLFMNPGYDTERKNSQNRKIFKINYLAMKSIASISLTYII